MFRRTALLLPLSALAACSRDPEISLPATPIGFRHLLPLRLNLAEVQVNEAGPFPLPGDFGDQMPVAPAAAVRQMAHERLYAVGRSGRAVFNVAQAVLRREGGSIVCALACRLDVVNAEGVRQGFIEASSRASMTLREGAADATRRRAGEAQLREALTRLNVEFEFQLRRNLRAWLVEGPLGAGVAPPAGGGVEREALPPAQ